MTYELYQINFIGTCINVGVLIGLIPAFIYDRWGGRITIVISGIMNFIGYFLMYCAVKGWLPTTHYLLLSFFGLIIGNGSAGGFLAALGDNMKNFRQVNRGTIVGILVACFGLSSVVFSMVYKYALHTNVEHYLLCLAITLGACYISGALFFARAEVQEQPTPMEVTDDSPLVVKPPVEETNYNCFQMITTMDYYMFAMLLGCGVGATTTIINSVGQMVIAFGGKDGDQIIHVILIAVMNCLGRIVMGLVTDGTRKWISRPTWIVIVSFGICLSQIFAALNYVSGMIYATAIMTGFLCGALWACAPAFIGDRWGKKHFGVNHEIVCIGGAIGTYVMSTLIAGKVYNEHITNQTKFCTDGVYCFQLTFFINAGICFLLSCIGILLAFKNRKLYEHLLEKR
jgi:MFS family permease